MSDHENWDEAAPHIEMVACPTCGALVGENCDGEHGIAHDERIKVTLHGIAEPPEPEEFPTAADYQAAYAAWWNRTHCWHAVVVDPILKEPLRRFDA